MVMSEQLYYFTSGLMAYWAAYILYIFALSRELNQPIRVLFYKFNSLSPFIIYLAYFIILILFISPHLGDLLIPIAIYALTLSFCCALTVSVYLNQYSKPRLYLCLGMISLSFAASAIGLNRFYLNKTLLSVITTLFYAPSLYSIFLYFITKKSYADQKL